jgi:hypothetical protein
MLRLPSSRLVQIHVVVDANARIRQARLERLAFLLDDASRCKVEECPDCRALHLVKDGIVRGVDLIATVDVCRQQPAVVSGGKDLDFVCRGVGAQTRGAVEVVCVARRASRMISGEAERAKVDVDINDGHGCGDGRVRGEQTLDACAQLRERMGRRVEQRRLGRDAREDGGGHVGVVVCGVAAPQHRRGRPCRRLARGKAAPARHAARQHGQPRRSQKQQRTACESEGHGCTLAQ